MIPRQRHHASAPWTAAAAQSDDELGIEQYRYLFEQNPQIMWVYDVETLGFLAVNDAAVSHYGYSRDEFLAMTIKDIRPAEDVPALLAAAAEHPARRLTPTPWRHFKKDGTIIDVEVASQPFRWQGREARLVLVHDTTERKRLEQQLIQAQKMEAIGRLAGGVAHDFNNLLTAVLGYSELLRDQLDEGDARLPDLEEIRKAGERAAALTQQLLAFSRKQVLQPCVLDLDGIVANVDKLLRRLIAEDIELVAIPARQPTGIKADRGQIEQVIINLVLNARDALPKGGKITIETARVEFRQSRDREGVQVRRGRYVMLAVSDTGSGMDRETQARIFEPFFTTKERGHGTGLGLATVYGIVKQSGGFIWVYSERSLGTTVKVYLPSVDEAVDTSTPAAERARSLRGSEDVLLVEDEEAVRGLARDVLRRQGYRVLEACTPDEALRLFDEHGGRVDLLLTDVVLPGRSGRELAQRLLSRQPGLKVLYTSGYAENAIVHHGVLDPGITLLQKPFTPDMLMRKVRQVLDAPADRARGRQASA